MKVSLFCRPLVFLAETPKSAEMTTEYTASSNYSAFLIMDNDIVYHAQFQSDNADTLNNYSRQRSTLKLLSNLQPLSHNHNNQMCC